MSTQLTFGYTDTVIPAYVAKTLTLAAINFGTDFRVTTQEPDEVIITNLTAPLDQPETFRFAFTMVPDIYKNSDVSISERLPSKVGMSIVCQHSSVLKVTDSVDATFSRLIPLKEHVVIVVPISSPLTTSQVITNLCRTMSGLFETGTNSTARLDSILRKCLVPSDL